MNVTLMMVMIAGHSHKPLQVSDVKSKSYKEQRTENAVSEMHVG